MLYLNTCGLCLKVACKTGIAPVCKSFLQGMYQTWSGFCEEHAGLFDTWNPDERQSDQCAEYSFNGEIVSCKRFKCLLTCSDMDTSLAEFVIQTAQQFTTFLNDEDKSFGPLSIHIHNIGHI